jgi:hypothetical protein
MNMRTNRSEGPNRAAHQSVFERVYRIVADASGLRINADQPGVGQKRRIDSSRLGELMNP